MSFPNVIYGDYGDEKVAQSTLIGSLPLGQLMILPDGRKYRHARAATATAMSAGWLYQNPGIQGGTSTERILEGTAAVGATSVVVQSPAGTIVTTDRYAEGFLFVASNGGTGVGRQYKVKSNGSAAAGSSDFTVHLYPSDPIETVISGTATLGLRENEFNGLIQTTADTVMLGKPAGVPSVAVSAGFYHWIQRSGLAPVKTSATVIVIGEPVVAATGHAGRIALIPAATAAVTTPKYNVVVGYGVTVGLGDGYSEIDLALE